MRPLTRIPVYKSTEKQNLKIEGRPVPDSPTSDMPGEWSLDDFQKLSGERQRFVSQSKAASEVVSFRADSFHVRRVDEILAARIDPELKTRSDIMQDALHLWLTTWDETYP